MMTNAPKALPQGWVECTLENLSVYVIGGDWGQSIDYDNVDYVSAYCIRGSEFKDWNKSKASTSVLRKVKNSNLAKRQLLINDIIIEISGGGPEQPVGRVVLVDSEALSYKPNVPKIHTNFLRLLRTTNKISQNYLYLYLQYFYISGAVTNYQGGSNNLRNLKFDQYLTISIPLPPLAEQKRIVGKIEALFSEIDKGTEELKTAQAKAKQYRQALLKHAFSGKLTADWRAEHGVSGEENGLPVGWVEKSLGDVVTYFQNGFSARRGKEGLETIVIRLADITKSKIDFSSIRQITMTSQEIEKYKVNEDEILVIRVNGSKDLVGSLIHVTNHSENFSYCDHFIKITLNHDELKPKWFSLLGNTKAYRNHIKNNMVSSAGQNTISQGTLKSFMFYLPPLPEQEEIVRRLEAQFSVLDVLEADLATNLKKAETLKQAILKKAFVGELVPQDPTDEPASELLKRIQAEKAMQAKTPKVPRKKKATTT